MSGLDGLGWPEDNTCKKCGCRDCDDPGWACSNDECPVRDSVCPHCGQGRTYYDGWNCPTEGCDALHNDKEHPTTQIAMERLFSLLAEHS